MKTDRSRALSMVFLAQILSQVILGQGIIRPAGQEGAPGQDTAVKQVLPFSPSGITEAFAETFDVITRSGLAQFPEEAILKYKEEVDTLVSAIDVFLSDTTLERFAGVGVRELDNINGKSNILLGNVGQLQSRLSKEADRLEESTSNLSIYKRRWELTAAGFTKDELTRARLTRIDETMFKIDSVRSLLQADLDAVMVQQDRLSERRNQMEALQARIKDQKMLLGEKLFRRDMPGFIEGLSGLKDTTMFRAHIVQLKRSVTSDLKIFRTKLLVPMLFVTAFVLALLGFSIWYKKHFARLISVDRFELSDMHMTLVYSPVVTVLFIAALVIRFIFPDLPETFRALNLIILMIPMLIIVLRLYGSLARTWMTILVVIYSITFIYELIYYPSIILRIVLLLISVIALILYLWMILKKPLLDRFRDTLLYHLFRIILLGFALLLFIAVIGNLVGAVRMAEFFTLIPIQTAVLAIGILVATRAADTLVFLLLASNKVQKLNVFREEFEPIYRKTTRLIRLLLWVFFFVTMLNIFRVKDAFYEWGRGVLTEGWKIGAVDITPGSILIFILVIWISIVVTRMVRHILEKDVFARVTTAKGMPSTIILLVRIALISGGFFLAAAAAGMKLTNLSIVLGAFSVGIGFGLQNIFNNMVSGLIIAFERPIKVGDTVQVGDLMGVVLSIGLRSSTVRSFDGAEVIVPNGNLISNQMINWTLSDSNRRMDIRVGVAYGTDPGLVLRLMEEVASEHAMVNRTPSPRAYFLGFGDSSLNFRLLAWTDIQDRLSVESELYVAVNNKLKKAGIEIPFPQRDVHIRSDATRGDNS
jgi:potassium efflux system protein